MAVESDSLDRILKGGPPKGPPPSPPPPPDDPEADVLTIEQMDGKYSTMRPANKNLTRLHIISRDGKVRSFQYHYLGPMSTCEGGKFVLLFEGARHWEVTVKGNGKGFWRLYDLVTLHKQSYLREATGSMPGVAEPDETVLTEIKIVDVTPENRE